LGKSVRLTPTCSIRSASSMLGAEAVALVFTAPSRQFGRTSAPIVPHFVHTIRGLKDGTVRSPGRWSTFTITSCRHWWHWTASDRTPFSRMLESVIGSTGPLKRDRAITTAPRAPAASPGCAGSSRRSKPAPGPASALNGVFETSRRFQVVPNEA
jgi:hypothetical protein